MVCFKQLLSLVAHDARPTPAGTVNGMAMHEDELHVDESLVRQLFLDQFPIWASRGVEEVATGGTDNAIFRIGDNLAARFPLRAAEPSNMHTKLTREATAMRELADHCSVPTPTPIAIGRPGCGYPLPWSVQTWVQGDVAMPTGLADSELFAKDLANLISSVRSADTYGRRFTGPGRGGDLQDSDEWMEVCFQKSEGMLPVCDLRKLWSQLRVLPVAGRETMTHGDLIPGNILVVRGRLSGILDGGGFSAADPSLDLVAAWHILDFDRRLIIRHELCCSDHEWLRGAAWAFQQAMGLVWYYRKTNPGMSELGRTTLDRLLRDPEVSTRLTPLK